MLRRIRTRDRSITVGCYSFFDKVFPRLGMLDYTEGIYGDDPNTPFEVAQQNQIDYVLDEVDCQAGTRLLELGCGNGSLLATAAARGAQAVGITISPEQVQRCRDRGLDARLLDYRDIPDEWSGRFDTVVANGPVEHFVHPQDAVEGRADAIYRQMFDICHRVIDPQSTNRRFINTTIHFVRAPDPAELLRSPLAHRRGSDAFHYAMLERSFGGYYPLPGQLERCAEGRFSILKTVDGTRDYHLTSEAWLRRVQQELASLRGAWQLVRHGLPVMVRQPVQCATMLWCMLGSQSWNWQFRGDDPPTRLLRQTWAYV